MTRRTCWLGRDYRDRTLATPKDVAECVDVIVNDTACEFGNKPVKELIRDAAFQAMRYALIAGGADPSHVNEHLFDKVPLRDEATNVELAALLTASFQGYKDGMKR